MPALNLNPAQPARPPVTASRNLIAFRFNLLVALVVWLLWLGFGRHYAIQHLISDWRVAVTMIFGSLVGGGTSEGGGAVAFPIFTKLLHIAPRDARNFSLAIQSIGMGAASLSILYLRIPIEKRSIAYAGIPGIIGVALSASLIAPHVPPVFVRTCFTVLVTSMGGALLLVNREKSPLRNPAIPLFGIREKLILIAAGFIGGIISALVGTGENTIIFLVMVLLFRMNEKVVTPTTVVLMTIVTIPGFLWHLFWMHDFSPAVMGYWVAALPVAVIAAPTGALICSHMKRHAIVLLLLFLIALEFTSTLFLVPFTRPLLLVSLAALILFVLVEIAMSRSRLYLPEKFNVS